MVTPRWWDATPKALALSKQDSSSTPGRSAPPRVPTRGGTAVCALAHASLLDAAHINPDADPDGIAAVRKGLALCKIRHAEYDADILGISPDLVVDVRADILAEVDGPMLRHGLQELHGSRLHVIPRSPGNRPDRDLLDARWCRYRAS